ncbi:hypothetical protein BZA77DRAFT_311514 [Pyronema omphalodes]|nr:hypothetical protein BZA77DRAFT_311514 [Pyronema omphalodes]
MASSDQKIEEAGHISHVKASRGQRVKAHFRKWWWAHLINFLIFALVVIIIAIYGVIPPVAQKLIDKTTLSINSFSITSPTGTSFQLGMDGVIKGANGPADHAVIDAFPVKLFLDDVRVNGQIRPILEFPVPKAHGGGDIHVVQKDIPITITDEDALDQYASRLMDSVEMRIGLRGRTTIHLGAIHTDVNYNEVVQLKGLNKLQGMVITKYTLYTNNSEGNVGGDVMIPNPTVTTIEMGDVGLKISYKGAPMGTGVIKNLTLRPGNNTYAFMSRITPDENILKLASVAVQKDSLTIGSNGTSINGVKIPWLSKPLETMESTVPINTDYFKEKGISPA